MAEKRSTSEEAKRSVGRLKDRGSEDKKLKKAEEKKIREFGFIADILNSNVEAGERDVLFAKIVKHLQSKGIKKKKKAMRHISNGGLSSNNDISSFVKSAMPSWVGAYVKEKDKEIAVEKEAAKAKRKEGTKNVGAGLFIFACVLWAIDALFTKFHGFNIDAFLVTISHFKENIPFIFFNSFALGFILIYPFLKKLENKLEWLSWALVIWTLSFFFFLSREFVQGYRFIGAILHIIFALFVLFDLKKNYEGSLTYYYRVFIIFIFIDFFMYSIILKIIHAWSIEKVFIVPFWVLYTLWIMRDARSKFSKIATIVVFILLIMGNPQLLAEGAKRAGGGTLIGITEEGGKKEFKSIPEAIKDSIKNIKETIEKKYNESITYATGDYYTSRVDQNVKEPLGVYITQIETLDPEVYEDEPIELWALLKAKSIEEPIESIKVNCTADIGIDPNPLKGKSKVTEFRDFIDEEEDIDCKFEEGALEAGTHIITFSAQFDFTTLAYLKTYFIDDNRLKTLKKENIDVFNQYGITDKDPIAISTNGPVRIGLETKTPPIGISDDYYTTPKFGITIENKWLGKIEEIKELIISLPEGIELEDNCDGAFEKFDSSMYDDLKGYNNYRFVIKTSSNWQNIETYKSRNCRLNIIDAGAVLGEDPISVKYIKVRVDYIYNSYESISINVKTPKGFNVYFDPKKPTISDIKKGELECVASHSDLYVIKAPFHIFVNDEKEPRIQYTKPSCGEKQHKCSFIIPDKIIDAAKLKRGDKIKCKVVRAELSGDIEETDSVIAKIHNSPPTIDSIKFNTQQAVIGEELKCVATVTDEEGDDLSAWAEVSINKEKISSYDYLKEDFDGDEYKVLIDLQKLYDDKKLKESDKISCKIGAVDYPGTEFERGYSEAEASPVEVTISLKQKIEEGRTLHEDCINPDTGEPDREGLTCGNSKKMNCLNGKCVTACEYVAAKDGHETIKSDWLCICIKDFVTDKILQEYSNYIIADHCPDENYCCDSIFGKEVLPFLEKES